MTAEQRAWHRAQCDAYKAEFPTYQDYARVLERILQAACRAEAPLAIVQARPKSFSSFAEKMARKAARYMALGIGPTDLCGARVITETQAEVGRICEVIRGSFVIDEENSIDVRSRLAAAEFGYLSVHYVVQLRGTEMFGVPVPPGIGDRKAEIQVRTLLQHAWASISHDRVYKSSFEAPPQLKRELARVAAFLEEADQQFGASVRSLDAYKVHYGAYMDSRQMEEEASILETVLEQEPEEAKKPAAALRLAEVARAEGDWNRVHDILGGYVAREGAYRSEVLAEHGHALCQLYQDRIDEAGFRQGREEIERALTGARGPVRSRALAYRAWASARIPDNEYEARDHYRQACEADPDNPFHLASYVGYEIFCGAPLGFHAVMKPAFLNAIERCRAHAEAGIELPWAFFTMGRFHLLLEQPYESLAACAKGIRVCLSSETSVPPETLDAELAFVRRIDRGQAAPETHAWIRDFLLLAKSVQKGRLQGLTPRRSEFQRPVAIMAGGTSAGSEKDLEPFRDTLLRAFEGFSGTVISGGTTAGIAGIAGAIGERPDAAAEVLGYLPRSLPPDQTRHPGYDALIATEARDSSAREALQYWTDLLAAGVSPAEVRAIGLGGGQISAFEYQMALAFGATLATIEPATRAAAEVFRDADWGRAALLPLPNDPMTIRAFLSPPHPALSADELDNAARGIHEAYLEQQRWNPDAAMQPWELLREDLKRSNRMQAERIAGFLEVVGYRVQRASATAAAPDLTAEEIERMAEMEHGRWVVERLQGGWRFDAKRDQDRKLNPDLVPWRDLPEEAKESDRKAVRRWPAIVKAAGLEIVRVK